jgi:DNA invertase Pin-like site-specific DNA recombinase
MKVAIYAKDMNEEQIADLRAWVVAQGYKEIIEYRDVTPHKGYLRDKEFGRMFQDARDAKLNIIFISSLKESGLIGTTPTNFLLAVITLKNYGVRLISREEPWTDLSTSELMIVYQAYCQHVDNEIKFSPKAKYTRFRTENNQRKDEINRDSY